MKINIEKINKSCAVNYDLGEISGIQTQNSGPLVSSQENT